MAINGIPISDEQCIGDSLPILNAAFTTLDSRLETLGLNVQSIQDQASSLATTNSLSGYIPRPYADSDQNFNVLTYQSSTATWLPSANKVSTANLASTGALNNSSGVVIQWGSYSFSNSSSAAVTFSKAFTTLYAIVPSNPDTVRHITVKESSTTGATLSAATAITGSGYYVAIGK